MIWLLSGVLRVKHVGDRSGTAYEVGMISVNVRILYSNKVLHHLRAWHQLFRYQLIHDFDDMFPEVWEPVELRQIDVCGDDPVQFLVDELHALDRGRLQSADLLLAEHFESHLRHEQVRSQRTRIPYRSLHILVRQRVERINVVQNFVIHFVEYVGETTAS